MPDWHLVLKTPNIQLIFGVIFTFGGCGLDMYRESVGTLSWLGLPHKGTEQLVGSRNVFLHWYIPDWILLV
jgi:hypothetical protein